MLKEVSSMPIHACSRRHTTHAHDTATDATLSTLRLPLYYSGCTCYIAALFLLFPCTSTDHTHSTTRLPSRPLGTHQHYAHPALACTCSAPPHTNNTGTRKKTTRTHTHTHTLSHTPPASLVERRDQIATNTNVNTPTQANETSNPCLLTQDEHHHVSPHGRRPHPPLALVLVPDPAVRRVPGASRGRRVRVLDRAVVLVPRVVRQQRAGLHLDRGRGQDASRPAESP